MIVERTKTTTKILKSFKQFYCLDQEILNKKFYKQSLAVIFNETCLKKYACMRVCWIYYQAILSCKHLFD